jgi:hypothetical protein
VSYVGASLAVYTAIGVAILFKPDYTVIRSRFIFRDFVWDGWARAKIVVATTALTQLPIILMDVVQKHELVIVFRKFLAGRTFFLTIFNIYRSRVSATLLRFKDGVAAREFVGDVVQKTIFQSLGFVVVTVPVALFVISNGSLERAGVLDFVSVNNVVVLSAALASVVESVFGYNILALTILLGSRELLDRSKSILLVAIAISCSYVIIDEPLLVFGTYLVASTFVNFMFFQIARHNDCGFSVFRRPKSGFP